MRSWSLLPNYKSMPFGLVIVVVLMLSSSCMAFVHPHLSEPAFMQIAKGTKYFSELCMGKIDYQNSESFGRGGNHLSAFLNEGDLVLYQTGTWLVDGVEVGDGSPPVIKYVKIDSMQIVWTHNCEHGVLRGFNVNLDQEAKRVTVPSLDEMIEFGPEQLIARIRVKWESEEENIGYIDVLPDQKSMLIAIDKFED